MNGGPCTRQQLRFFKEQGYIILESLIPCRALDAWRSQIWKHFGSSLETPATWPDNRVIEDFTFDDPSLAFGRLPEVTAVVEQLGGG